MRKPNMMTTLSRTSDIVQDVRIRETITIGEGTSALTGRLNSQLLGSLDISRAVFSKIRRATRGIWRVRSTPINTRVRIRV